MSLRVLGLDLSYEGCGIAATHDTDGRPRLRVRTLRPGSRRGLDRLAFIVGEITNELRWLPDLVVIEQPFVQHNNTTLALAKLHGCVELELYRNDVPFVHVAPLTLKVFATGSGKADKELVIHMMRARYGNVLGGPSRIQTDGDADALALATMGRHAYGQPIAPIPAEAARALKTVHWPQLTSSRPGPAAPAIAVDPGWDSIAKPEGALI